MKYERNGNKVRFLDTEGITTVTWRTLLSRINYLGYDLPDVKCLKDYFDRHTFLNEDQSIEVLKVFGETVEETKYTEHQLGEYVHKAKMHFGTTESLSLAGYILTDGSLLKMCYDSYSPRDIDHREIKQVMDVDCSEDNSAAMNVFIGLGNIRLQQSGFELQKLPTPPQRRRIADLIRKVRNYSGSDHSLTVDIANYQGRVVKSFEYDFPSISDVFNDIEGYFKSIEIPAPAKFSEGIFTDIQDIPLR